MLLENEYLKDLRVIKEVQTLSKSGHHVTVATSTLSDLPSEETGENCLILRKRISQFVLKSSVGALKFPFYFNFWRRFVDEIFLKNSFDVVHIHDLPLCQIGIDLKKKYGLKLVIDLHENWPALLKVSSHTNTLLGKVLSSEKQWRKFERDCCISADAIITVVDEMKERISKLGITNKKIFVLENTPPANSVKEFEFERDESYFTLVYLGGISFHRGLQYIISSLKFVASEIPVRFLIAGQGKFISTLKDQIRKLNLENNIKFLGILSKEEVEKLLKKADFGLIPHIRSEQSDNSSPNKLFEYMAVGLPVLASNCTSVKRVLDETQSGQTYIFDSTLDFTKVLTDLYRDRNKSGIFAINGRKAIREKYNWEKSSLSLLNLYKTL